MIDGLIAGKIYGQAKKGVGKNGSVYFTAKVRAAGGDGEPLLVNVITFSQTAGQALTALGDGESVALSGSLTVKVWKDRDGVVRPALDMQAHAVLTAHPARKQGQVAGEDSANTPRD